MCSHHPTKLDVHYRLPCRKSRMSSSASTASSIVDPVSSADEGSNLTTPSTPATSQPPSEATTPTPAASNKAFQFPKTKKVGFIHM